MAKDGIKDGKKPELKVVGASITRGLDEARVWADWARTVVRRAGHNRGAARDALIELFAAEDCALSVPEVEARLSEERLDVKRPVARASIYRGIELMHSLELLTRIDVGDGVARYERAHHDHGDHHHHMVCERCGLLMPFDDDLLEAAIRQLSERIGFETNGHEVTLRGTCLECQ